MFYNENLKNEFLKQNENKSYYTAYVSMFKLFESFEELLKKDICMFDKRDLMMAISNVSKKIKYNTALTYNALVGNYKEWVNNAGKAEVINDILNVEEVKKIQGYRKYIIFNDYEIDNLTVGNSNIDGADYNLILFIRIFWETDAQENVTNILSIRDSDLLEDNNIRIYDYKTCEYNRYTVSTWLYETLLDYSEVSKLEFAGKSGSYNILTSAQNNGYIFRTTINKRSKIGEPINKVKFSNMLYSYMDKKFKEIQINLNDFKMSLALRHMLLNFKTPSEMQSDRKYFANLPAKIYEEVFCDNAEKKYPDLFKKYLEYYNSFTSNQVVKL